jgi:chromate transport protein ChrA
VIWTVARVLASAVALGVILIVPLYMQSSDGTTQLLTDGVVIDAVAVAVIVAAAWSLLRDRRRS